jgi:hypothetical protein
LGLDKEKRRAKREQHDSVLELCDVAGRLLTGIVRLIDVSTHGACFASSETLQEGQQVRGRLRLLRTGPFDVSGRVVWRRRKGNVFLYGLEFDQANRAAPAANENLGGTE